MKTIDQATTRELEIAQVKLAIARTNVDICRMENDLAAMRKKQIARHKEVARQEVLKSVTPPPDDRDWFAKYLNDECAKYPLMPSIADVAKHYMDASASHYRANLDRIMQHQETQNKP